MVKEKITSLLSFIKDCEDYKNSNNIFIDEEARVEEEIKGYKSTIRYLRKLLKLIEEEEKAK